MSSPVINGVLAIERYGTWREDWVGTGPVSGGVHCEADLADALLTQPLEDRRCNGERDRNSQTSRPGRPLVELTGHRQSEARYS